MFFFSSFLFFCGLRDALTMTLRVSITLFKSSPRLEKEEKESGDEKEREREREQDKESGCGSQLRATERADVVCGPVQHPARRALSVIDSFIFDESASRLTRRLAVGNPRSFSSTWVRGQARRANQSGLQMLIGQGRSGVHFISSLETHLDNIFNIYFN